MLTALPLYEANKLMALEIAVNNILNTPIEHLQKSIVVKRDNYEKQDVKDVKAHLMVMNNYNRTLRVLDLVRKLKEDLQCDIHDIPKVGDNFRLEL